MPTTRKRKSEATSNEDEHSDHTDSDINSDVNYLVKLKLQSFLDEFDLEGMKLLSHYCTFKLPFLFIKTIFLCFKQIFVRVRLLQCF